MCKLKKFRVNMKIAKIPGTCSENIQKVGWKRADQPDRSILVLFETKDKRCGLTLRVLGFIKLMSNSLLSDQYDIFHFGHKRQVRMNLLLGSFPKGIRTNQSLTSLCISDTPCLNFQYGTTLILCPTIEFPGSCDLISAIYLSFIS